MPRRQRAQLVSKRRWNFIIAASSAMPAGLSGGSHGAPQESEYHIYLARSSHMKGYSCSRSNIFIKRSSWAPKNADYYAEFGLYQKISLFRQADEMFDKALEILPDHPIVPRRAARLKTAHAESSLRRG